MWGKKRAKWNELSGMWGKRAWSDMSGGWGKSKYKSLISATIINCLSPLFQFTEKRSSSPHWNKLRGMWGKRSVLPALPPPASGKSGSSGSGGHQ